MENTTNGLMNFVNPIVKINEVYNKWLNLLLKGRLATKHYQQKEIQMKKKIGIEGLEVQTIADCYRVFRDKLKFPD